MAIRETFIPVGGVFLLLFIFMVSLPYYYGGYQQFNSLWQCQGEGLELKNQIIAALNNVDNWTTNPILQTFTYFLSWPVISFYWIVSSLVMICLGTLRVSDHYLIVIKSILIILAAWALTELQKYQLIDFALF